MIVTVSHALVEDLKNISESRVGDFIWLDPNEAKVLYDLIKQHPDVIEILKVYYEGVK